MQDTDTDIEIYKKLIERCGGAERIQKNLTSDDYYIRYAAGLIIGLGLLLNSEENGKEIPPLGKEL